MSGDKLTMELFSELILKVSIERRMSGYNPSVFKHKFVNTL